MTAPRHIGVIMDGNRRYAKKHALETLRGHKAGLDKVKELIEWCLEADIKELTLFALSTENFQRDPKELAYLFDLFRATATDEKFLEHAAHEGISLHFVGHKTLLPPDLVAMMRGMEEKTKENKRLVVNYAISYGSRAEIVEACRAIAREVKAGDLKSEQIDEKTILSHLWIPRDVELVIRTSGEKRLSNFLLYQSAYAEWFFPPQLFPELTREDFFGILREFEKRERRFGK